MKKCTIYKLLGGIVSIALISGGMVAITTNCSKDDIFEIKVDCKSELKEGTTNSAVIEVTIPPGKTAPTNLMTSSNVGFQGLGTNWQQSGHILIQEIGIGSTTEGAHTVTVSGSGIKNVDVLCDVQAADVIRKIDGSDWVGIKWGAAGALTSSSYRINGDVVTYDSFEPRQREAELNNVVFPGRVVDPDGKVYDAEYNSASSFLYECSSVTGSITFDDKVKLGRVACASDLNMSVTAIVTGTNMTKFELSYRITDNNSYIRVIDMGRSKTAQPIFGSEDIWKNVYHSIYHCENLDQIICGFDVGADLDKQFSEMYLASNGSGSVAETGFISCLGSMSASDILIFLKGKYVPDSYTKYFDGWIAR